jgi:hypothetical protein
VRHRARHHVDFIESGARDQQVRVLSLDAPEHLSAGAAAGLERDVQSVEAFPDFGVLVDDREAVIFRQLTRQRKPDFTAANDDDLQTRTPG